MEALGYVFGDLGLEGVKLRLDEKIVVGMEGVHV
jgi:hypothetical protein